MKLIVGLGNPGHTYNHTRHNAGFMVIEALGQRRGVQVTDRHVSSVDGRPACVSGDYELSGNVVRLLMPLSMMNESGEALRGLEVPLERVLIVCDDVNLPVGTIRLRREGGPGGHHGLQSCLETLGTEAVPRLRIGVGTPPLPRDLEDFVLSPFPSAERPVIKRALEQAADACEQWATEGIEAAMNRYNTTQDTVHE